MIVVRTHKLATVKNHLALTTSCSESHCSVSPHACKVNDLTLLVVLQNVNRQLWDMRCIPVTLCTMKATPYKPMTGAPAPYAASGPGQCRQVPALEATALLHLADCTREHNKTTVVERLELCVKQLYAEHKMHTLGDCMLHCSTPLWFTTQNTFHYTTGKMGVSTASRTKCMQAVWRCPVPLPHGSC